MSIRDVHPDTHISPEISSDTWCDRNLRFKTFDATGVSLHTWTYSFKLWSLYVPQYQMWHASIFQEHKSYKCSILSNIHYQSNVVCNTSYIKLYSPIWHQRRCHNQVKHESLESESAVDFLSFFETHKFICLNTLHQYHESFDTNSHWLQPLNQVYSMS